MKLSAHTIFDNKYSGFRRMDVLRLTASRHAPHLARTMKQSPAWIVTTCSAESADLSKRNPQDRQVTEILSGGRMHFCYEMIMPKTKSLL
jgi:hypothetical protein